MENYHIDMIWSINIALALAIALTVISIAACVMLKSALLLRRKKDLYKIKANIIEMHRAMASGAPETIPPAIAKATLEEYIDIESNFGRDSVFFNDEERGILEKCFARPDNMEKLKKTASGGITKWKKIEAVLCLGCTRSEEALDVLSSSLHSRDKDISYFAMISMGRIKTRRSAAALLEAFTKYPSYRLKISSILASFPDEISGDILKLSHDSDPEVRASALALLSEFNTSRCVGELEKLLEDPVPEVRAAACGCLARSGRGEAADAIKKHLKDDSWLVKMHAVKSLGRIMGERSVPLVAPMISSASWSVIGAIREIMSSHIKAALPYITQYLEGRDEIAKKEAILALEESGYMAKLMADAIEGKDAASVKLLEKIVRFGAHFGLESSIADMSAADRDRAIAIIGKIDPAVADHIEKRVKGHAGEDNYI